MKKMNMRKSLGTMEKKIKLTTLGFTLVELLAVIVILAIVLIIAVPGVLSIINSTKENAYKSQLKMIKEAARTYITAESDKVSWNDKTTVVTLGMLQSNGFLEKKIVDPRNKKEIVCVTVLVSKDKNNKISYDIDDTCNNVYPITPRIGSGMIPIVYNGTNWVKADTSNQNFSWFNYGNQQWANIATVTEDVRASLMNAESGTVVPISKINAMYTWIPRFKYKLWNVGETVSPVGNSNMVGDYLIDVQFETKGTEKSTGTQNGQWLTHPAFTFGGEELEGFWVSKFGVSYDGAKTPLEAARNVIDSSKITIKPNFSLWNEINVGVAYRNAQGMSKDSNVFGISNMEDPHMMKNMEWGAVTYLSSSRYGKHGSFLYSGDNRFVGPNLNSDYLSGCGSYKRGDVSNQCNTYDTVEGQAASTTGNISGAYDFSGPLNSYVAAVIKNASGDVSLGETSSYFTQAELNQIGAEQKYLDVYDYGISDVEHSRMKLGDATKEMGPFVDNYLSTPPYSSSSNSWNKDASIVVSSIWPWMVRAGKGSVIPGITFSSRATGGVTKFATFRIVLK